MLYNERAPRQFAGFARSASGALHCCGPISSLDQSPFRVRRQQDHWLMFITLHCRRSVYVLTRLFSCCHSAILLAIFRELKYLTDLLNTGTISTPKLAFYNLCICFFVVLLRDSLIILSYIKYIDVEMVETQLCVWINMTMWRIFRGI